MEQAYIKKPQLPIQPLYNNSPGSVTYVPAGTLVPPDQNFSWSSITSKALGAGMLGFVVVSTGAMGANLNKVAAEEMSFGQAVGDSFIKGTSGAVAAASASTATSTLTTGGLAGLAVTIATATGVSYLINRVKS